MIRRKRTLKEWEQTKGLNIIDYDGFDRNDEKLFERLFTEKEFDEGFPLCTQYMKAKEMSEIKTKDIVELLEYTLQNRAFSIDENLALSHAVKQLNKHDALVERNEYLEAKLEWLESMEYTKSLEIRVKKAEAKVEKLIFNVKENGYQPTCGCVRCDDIRDAIYDMVERDDAK